MRVSTEKRGVARLLAMYPLLMEKFQSASFWTNPDVFVISFS